MPLGELAQSLILHSLCCSPVCITLIMLDGETFQKLKQFSNKDAPFKKHNDITLLCDALFVPAMNLKNVLQMLVQIINAWVGTGGRSRKKQTSVSRKERPLPSPLSSCDLPRIAGAGPGPAIHRTASLCPGSWTDSDNRRAVFK